MLRGFVSALVMVGLTLGGCRTNPGSTGTPAQVNPPAQAGTPAEVTPTAQAGTPTAATDLLQPPLQLARPKPPPTEYVIGDLDGDELKAAMQHLYEQGKYADAAAFGCAAVAEGQDERYNLACYLALAGEVESSLYYLQEAVQQEGVDPGLAETDPDLEAVRADPRWPVIRNYIKAQADYWAVHTPLVTSLVVPPGYHGERPIPVVIGLHGLGGSQEFVGPDLESVAGKLDCAFLGVSGTVAVGPRAFRWSEDHQRDARHVAEALKSVDRDLKVAPGRVVYFGFSQGGALAYSLACDPQPCQGALCVSPGTVGANPACKPPRGRRFVIVAGEAEHPDTVACARKFAALAGAGHCQSKLQLYPGMSEHRFPDDFGERFPVWLKWVLSAK